MALSPRKLLLTKFAMRGSANSPASLTAANNTVLSGSNPAIGVGALAGGTVTLASAGLGVRLAVFRDSALQLEAARQLDVPPGFHHDWVFNVAVRVLQ